MQIAAAGDAVLQTHAEPHRARARLAANVAEARARRSVRIRPPKAATPDTALQRHLAADLGGIEVARSQAYFTAPRSMTAKLSPSSQAKSRYCSTSTIAMLPRLRR